MVKTDKIYGPSLWSPHKLWCSKWIQGVGYLQQQHPFCSVPWPKGTCLVPSLTFFSPQLKQVAQVVPVATMMHLKSSPGTRKVSKSLHTQPPPPSHKMVQTVTLLCLSAHKVEGGRWKCDSLSHSLFQAQDSLEMQNVCVFSFSLSGRGLIQGRRREETRGRGAHDIHSKIQECLWAKIRWKSPNLVFRDAWQITGLVFFICCPAKVFCWLSAVLYHFLAAEAASHYFPLSPDCGEVTRLQNLLHFLPPFKDLFVYEGICSQWTSLSEVSDYSCHFCPRC